MARRDREERTFDVESALRDLSNEATTLGIDFEGSPADQIRSYLETLLLWNRRISLVSQNDPTEIVRKHFADSLHVVPMCASAECVVDLGSGAGFPGLVIAIARPDASVCLVDTSRKKASFLAQVIAQAKVRNARVVEARIEQVAAAEDQRARYTVATSRALAKVETFLQLARPLLSSAGRAIAMKGPGYIAEIDSFDPARCGFGPPAIREYSLPDGERRVLLSFSVAAE